MHEWGDSGITAILLAIVILVLVTLGLAQQARARATRYQEIRRLQSFTAEEARREEAQAHAEYTSMSANRHICAVCLNLSSTRCSRCKAVRYCSTKCQMQHWREGHKQECRPPPKVSLASASPLSSCNGSGNFSKAFSSSNGDSRSGSTTYSKEKISVLRGDDDDAAPADSARTAPSSQENGTLQKPIKMLFPYNYFVKLFNWERMNVPPCGLVNCGNSCFANVVLQCLTYTRPLAALLLEGTHGRQCRRNSWCFMCELQDHVLKARQSFNPFSPIEILSRIRNIGGSLGYGRQEDAHEFMRFAIDSMQSICLDEAGGEKAVEPRVQETTFVQHVFGGHLQSQVKCMGCLHESNRYENMMDLTVEIQGCVETLEDALRQFTASEWLDGENKYKCDRCNAYVKAQKRLTVYEAPNILTIALKRFQTGKFGKLNKRVTFPEELVVDPYMSGSGDQPPPYKLYAVVVHVDMLNASFFGHYICYVKDSEGLWYKVDDSKVKEVSLEKVMAQKAYMLFYKRSFARPPPLMDKGSSPYPVAETPELARVATDEQETSLHFFPVPPYRRSDGILAPVGAQGLQALLNSNQIVAEDVDTSPETSLEQSHSNGDIHMGRQPGSWEIEEQASSSTSTNGDEISAEDSSGGCVPSSSSLTQTSPYISSYTSNPGVWVPNQGFVRRGLDHSSPAGLEGLPLPKWDHDSTLPHDFSEVSIEPCTMDMPSTSSKNNGKRRLEDGLSSLRTPRPLDTNQLPAWPLGSHGRSIHSPVLLPHVSANPTTGSTTSSESLCSWQQYDAQNVVEPGLSSSSFPQHGRIPFSSDPILNPPLGFDSAQEPHRNNYFEVETAVGDEVESARAKRQHVEIERTGSPEAAVQQQKSAISQGMVIEEGLGAFEIGGTDMDWAEEAMEDGGSPTGSTSGPRLEFPEANASPEAGPELLWSEPHEVARSLNNSPQSEEVSSLSPRKETDGVESGDPTCEAEVPEFSASARAVPTTENEGRTPSVEEGESTDVLMQIQSGDGHGNPEVTGETAGVVSAQPLSSPPDALQENFLKIAACYAGIIEQANLVYQPMDCDEHDLPTEESRGPIPPEVDFHLDRSTSLLAPASTESPGPGPGEAEPPLDVPKRTPQKSSGNKSTSKPLFAPGFLNKVRTSVPESKASRSRNPVSHTRKVALQVGETGLLNEVHSSAQGDVNQVVLQEGANEQLPHVDQRISSNEVLQADGVGGKADEDEQVLCNGTPSGLSCREEEANGHPPINIPRKEGFSDKGNTTAASCETLNPAVDLGERQIENGHGAAMDNILEPDVHEDHKLLNAQTAAAGRAPPPLANGPSAQLKGAQGKPHHSDGSKSSSSGARKVNSEQQVVEPVNGQPQQQHVQRTVSGTATEPPVIGSTATAAEAVAGVRAAVNGKQKQGRNETCNCGSQRKWKKCCGKTGVIKPEPGRRRLVV